MSRVYDVAVVGAGPSGSTSARVIAESGATVLLLDRAPFPRTKCCAGALPALALPHLPFEVDARNATPISSAILSFESKEEVVCSHAGTLGWTVERERFDALLVERAVTAGATFVDGRKVRQLQRVGDRWSIAADGESFVSRFVIGADGAAGVVARSAGISRRPLLASCIEARVNVPDTARDRIAGVAKFDFGRVDSGYAWVFAKAGYVSAGIYSTRPVSGGRLRRTLEVFLASEPRVAGGRVFDVKRWFVPRGSGRHSNLHFAGGLLVGDAAGLADPLTGEGIRHALHSGRIAGEVLVECLRSPGASLARYSEEVDQALRPGFRIARVCSAIAFRSRGRLVGRFVRSGLAEEPWGSLARGEVPYPKLSWGLAALVSGFPWKRRRGGPKGPREGRPQREPRR